MNALPWGNPLTYDDLRAMPEDGHRYELIDGALIVTPAPRHAHQRVVSNLLGMFWNVLPGSLEVLTAPFDYVVSTVTVLQPDLLVVRPADVGELNLQRAPILAVEVLSPSTRRVDAGTKRLVLEEAGVPHYWLVDPDVPSVIALELVDGAYLEAAHVVGHDRFETATPFPFSVRPADLIRSGRPPRESAP